MDKEQVEILTEWLPTWYKMTGDNDHKWVAEQILKSYISRTKLEKLLEEEAIPNVDDRTSVEKIELEVQYAAGYNALRQELKKELGI